MVGLTNGHARPQQMNGHTNGHVDNNGQEPVDVYELELEDDGSPSKAKSVSL